MLFIHFKEKYSLNSTSLPFLYFLSSVRIQSSRVTFRTIHVWFDCSQERNHPDLGWSGRRELSPVFHFTNLPTIWLTKNIFFRKTNQPYDDEAPNAQRCENTNECKLFIDQGNQAFKELIRYMQSFRRSLSLPISSGSRRHVRWRHYCLFPRYIVSIDVFWTSIYTSK